MPINYREIVESLSDIVFELDLNGKFVYANTRMLELTGYNIEELKSMQYFTLVQASWREKVKAFYNDQAKDSQEDSFLEFPMLTKSGDTLWVAQKVRFLFNEDLLVSKVTAVAREINEQVKMRKDLSKKENIIAQLKGIADIGLWEYDVITGLVDWSSQMFPVFDLPKGPIPSLEEALSYYDDESLPVITKVFTKAIQTGKSYDVELSIITAKNVSKRVRSIGIPIYENGTVIKVHGLFQDITTQHLQELHLLDKNATLTKAKKETEHQAKLKDDFLSSVSHDLRTALNIITSLSKILVHENPRQDQLEYLETLNYSADNLIDLVNDILDFRRIEEGKISLSIHDVDFGKLLKGFKNSMHEKALEKGLKFNLEADIAIPNYIKVDRTRLSQILFNLTSNAIKFTHTGSVKVKIDCLEAPPDKVALKFSVSDTGIGIASDKHDLIFDRFTQSSSGIAQEYGGSGLGLNITKSLLELMESTIEIKSIPGEGSEFYFTLILDASGKTEEEAKDHFTPDIFYKEKPLTPYTILVADDNEVNLLVAKKQLESWGASVICVSDGLEAVSSFKNLGPDLILMDIQMPILNGCEASKRIRTIDSEVPIIALSAGRISETKKIAKICGINHVSSKPINQSELITSIARLLNIKPTVSRINIADELTLKKLEKLADGDDDFYFDLLKSAKTELLVLTKFFEPTDSALSKKLFISTTHRILPTLRMLNAYNLIDGIDKANNSDLKTIESYSENICGLTKKIICKIDNTLVLEVK